MTTITTLRDYFEACPDDAAFILWNREETLEGMKTRVGPAVQDGKIVKIERSTARNVEGEPGRRYLITVRWNGSAGKATWLCTRFYGELDPEAVVLEDRIMEDARRRGEEQQAERQRLIDAGEVEVVTVCRCPECEALIEEDDVLAAEDNPRYECGNCGNAFSRDETGSHRCEQCGKFASKVADATCPECNEGVEEFEEVQAMLEEDGGFTPLED